MSATAEVPVKPPPEPERTRLFFRYCIYTGADKRWGPSWQYECPERVTCIEREIEVIEGMGFCAYFLILGKLMDWMRSEKIVYGPGRGSVGGSLVAYCMHIHEADPLEFGLIFERFMNPSRVAYPDVDIDVSQRHRPRVLKWIRREFEDENTVVLQIPAFQKAGARTLIDLMAAARSQTDESAYEIAIQLKRLLPEGNNITGGTKQEYELQWWLDPDNDKKGKGAKNREAFRELAEKAGWLDTMLKLDGAKMNLGKHAAGVVIISRDDLKRLPQTGAKDTDADEWRMMAGFDMYSLDDLKYLKIDILGLRTLDIISDAHIFCGGDGTTPALMKLWKTQRDVDKASYQLMADADTTGVFQVETPGYRKTLKEAHPTEFEHVVQLNALYRPGALDSVREDGKNMVDVFIDRLHGREPIAYPDELRGALTDVLGDTQGIILYQEQAMKLAVLLAGFTDTEADNLRKAIGKKQLDRMAAIKDAFIDGMEKNGYTRTGATTVWNWIEAAARYSWNRSHSVFYGCITWICAFFKANRRIDLPDLGLHGHGTAAFYAALINSLSADKDRQTDAVAECRQHVTIAPPDINVALDSYTLDEDGHVVFGLNGIKGMGEANRNAIIMDRVFHGPYDSFAGFHTRLPSVPINMKLSLIKCGAFDSLEDRTWLLARWQKPGRVSKDGEAVEGGWVTVAELIKHNAGLKNPRPLPDPWELTPPTERELGDGELETIGFYVSADPMKDVNIALARLDRTNYFGGQIEKLEIKTDRRGSTYGKFVILTPALTKQRCMVFGSNWPQCAQHVFKGNRVIMKGYMDGSQLIADSVFTAGDYRHFKVMIMKRGDEREAVTFDGNFDTVLMAEASGYTVELK